MTIGGRIPSEPTLATLVKDFAIRWRMPATVEVEGDIEALNDATAGSGLRDRERGARQRRQAFGSPGCARRVVGEADSLHIEVTTEGAAWPP